MVDHGAPAPSVPAPATWWACGPSNGWEPAFPYGTLIVNLAGCFVLGVVAHIATAAAWSPELRGAVVIGFLGGFTTYSSFNQETLAMLGSGATGAAVLNIAVTLMAGLAAGWFGLVVARQLVA